MMADNGVPEPDREVMLSAGRAVIRTVRTMHLTDDQAAEVIAGFISGSWQDGWCSYRDTMAAIQSLKRRQPH